MIKTVTQGFLHFVVKYKIKKLKKLLTIHFTYSNITIVRGGQLRTETEYAIVA